MLKKILKFYLYVQILLNLLIIPILLMFHFCGISISTVKLLDGNITIIKYFYRLLETTVIYIPILYLCIYAMQSTYRYVKYEISNNFGVITNLLYLLFLLLFKLFLIAFAIYTLKLII